MLQLLRRTSLSTEPNNFTKNPPQCVHHHAASGDCIVITHTASGRFIFVDSVLTIPAQVSETGAVTYFYTTTRFPVSMTSNVEIAGRSTHVASSPRVVVPGGTAALFVDLKPGTSTPMRRTVSLHYGAVIEGEIELELDDSEVRRVRKGDLTVQRGTVHKWMNATPDGGWLKISFATQASGPSEVHEEVLSENWRPQPPMKKSSL